MNVFILSTGRSGSTTLERACSHITNYSADHESRSHLVGEDRLAYPNNHIESDNRLSWFLGRLENNYSGSETFYVVLSRDREKIAHSYAKRFIPGLILQAYANGILLRTIPLNQAWRAKLPLTENKKLEIARDYVDTVMANIELFIKNKSNVIRMDIDNPIPQFKKLWQSIGAEGNLDCALNEFKIKHNPSEKTEVLGLHSLSKLMRVSYEKLKRIIIKLPSFISEA